METRTEKTNCPTCGTTIDAVSDPVGDARPKPGDITICLYCQDIFKFGETLSLQPLEEADIADLPIDIISRYQMAISKVMSTPCKGHEHE